MVFIIKLCIVPIINIVLTFAKDWLTRRKVIVGTIQFLKISTFKTTFKVTASPVKGETMLVVVLNFCIMPTSIVLKFEDCLTITTVFDWARFCLWPAGQ